MQQALLDVLEIRFGGAKAATRTAIAAINNPADLKTLHQRSLGADSLEVFEQALERLP